MFEKLHFYTWGHTAQGLKSFTESNLLNIDKLFVLKHPSETVKTAVIKKVIGDYEDTSKIEVIRGINGNEYLDGVIIPDQSLAVLARPVKLDRASVIEIKSSVDSTEIDELFDRKNLITTKAYEDFATGLKVHDELEEIYIKEMNFDKADQLATEFINKLLSYRPIPEENGYIYHRLFGTNTKNGIVNVVPKLISNVTKTFFIKGRAGTGKSTFMKKIANACSQHGFDVELYHCSFDSGSIDMVLVRDLDFCIFDSTDPHEFFPSREGDEVIDLYKELVTSGTDEKFKIEIDELNDRYKSYMRKGNERLKEAGLYQTLVEEKCKQYDSNNLDINKVVESIESTQ
ncbi:hypothetical protein [Virgibacillus sp. DJP39]|uniref:hypothetical protein n=1 Tax=Virgibacillus sp. DJP39 TaxID=3409790 RepID=UPI003BB5A3D0